MWVSVQECIGLPMMPTTPENIRNRLNKLAEGRPGMKRARQTGKGYEYNPAILPKETREALLLRQVMASAPAVVEEPKALEGELLLAGQRSWDSFSQKQRDCASARLAFVREIERMTQIMSQAQAIRHLLQLSTEGRLPERLVDRESVANEKGSLLSARSLQRWISLFKAGGHVALVPGKREAAMGVPGWWPVFAPFWQKPQKPSLADAYRCYVAETPGPHATERQVSYFMSKLSAASRNEGRMSKEKLKEFEPYKLLESGHMLPNDCWQIDGHRFDAEVIHPIKNKPFRPEVTAIIDWATREWVGFSINLNESGISTVDAIRDAVVKHGMFRVLYTDNGPGFKDNAVVDKVCDTLGGSLRRATPYNSQAKGLVERFHRSVLVNLAKRYPSYLGEDMDGQAGTKVHKLGRALIKQGTREAKQRLTALMPDIHTFYNDLLAAQEEYNNTPHRGLPKIRDPETGKLRHMNPREIKAQKVEVGFRAVTGSVALIEMLCRPYEVRKVRRGYVSFMYQQYFSEDLDPLHGEEVLVHYDFRDAYRVWIVSLGGKFICEAHFRGNSVDAIPQSVINRAEEKQIKGQLKRLTDKVETVTGLQVDIVPKAKAPEISAMQQMELMALSAKKEQPQTALPAEPTIPLFVLPQLPTKKYLMWEDLYLRQVAGEEIGEMQSRWVANFPKTIEWRSAKEMLIREGVKVIDYPPIPNEHEITNRRIQQ